jgi:hypothetical protein
MAGADEQATGSEVDDVDHGVVQPTLIPLRITRRTPFRLWRTESFKPALRRNPTEDPQQFFRVLGRGLDVSGGAVAEDASREGKSQTSRMTPLMSAG